MPIETDTSTSLPEISTDASGRELISPELDSVDASGRPFEPGDPAKQTPLEDPPTPTDPAKPVDKKDYATESRKLFLQAQKAERRAKEMEKKAASSLAVVEAFEKAKSSAQSGQDPTALLLAAGLDPVKFHRDMIVYATNPQNKPEDPVQKELRETREQLAKYAKDKEAFEVQIKTEKENQIHNKNISERVIPLLNNNPEKYEILLTEYGANAAIEIYKAVWDAYNLPDDQKPEGWKMPTFEEAADRIEEYWYNTRKSAIIEASKKKKFQDLFARNPDSSPETNIDQLETPRRSHTLSNKQSISAAPKQQQYDRVLSRDERAKEILKKFG
jgi:hypothetical protein